MKGKRTNLAKKSLLLLLTLVLCAALCACGKDYDSRLFNFFGESFRWTMDPDDGEVFIKENQSTNSYVDTEKSSSYIIVSDDTYTLRFTLDGDLEFLKIKVSNAKSTLKDITEAYGEPDEQKDVAGSPFYYWYGTMDGKPTCMTLETNSITDTCYIGLYPEE